MKATEVVIKITDKGWTKTVSINGKEFTEDWKLTNFGGRNDGQCLEEIDNIPDELYEAISSDDPYEIARAIRNV